MPGQLLASGGGSTAQPQGTIFGIYPPSEAPQPCTHGVDLGLFCFGTLGALRMEGNNHVFTGLWSELCRVVTCGGVAHSVPSLCRFVPVTRAAVCPATQYWSSSCSAEIWSELASVDCSTVLTSTSDESSVVSVESL